MPVGTRMSMGMGMKTRMKMLSNRVVDVNGDERRKKMKGMKVKGKRTREMQGKDLW